MHPVCRQVDSRDLADVREIKRLLTPLTMKVTRLHAELESLLDDDSSMQVRGSTGSGLTFPSNVCGL